ncbi:MAG: hypothetical protein EZS28_003693 [Streblomastix strix]|uniref:SH3 domain-containing protein n=1 Tax=Streblomastix strix TaxID=222440 RepID=A0A5J4X286_9EUKA|nr:MAG: hypothetical protein EZS28_003693 [Streblomastix strix]
MTFAQPVVLDPAVDFAGKLWEGVQIVRDRVAKGKQTYEQIIVRLTKNFMAEEAFYKNIKARKFIPITEEGHILLLFLFHIFFSLIIILMSRTLAQSWQELKKHMESIESFSQELYTHYKELLDETTKESEEYGRLTKGIVDEMAALQKKRKEVGDEMGKKFDKYVSAFKDWDDSENSFEKIKGDLHIKHEKLAKIRKTADDKMAVKNTAEENYTLSVNEYNNTLSEYEEKMARQFQLFEEVEMKRMKSVGDKLKNMFNKWDNMLILIHESVRNSLLSIQMHNPLADLFAFSTQNVTGAPHSLRLKPDYQRRANGQVVPPQNVQLPTREIQTQGVGSSLQKGVVSSVTSKGFSGQTFSGNTSSLANLELLSNITPLPVDATDGYGNIIGSGIGAGASDLGATMQGMINMTSYFYRAQYAFKPENEKEIAMNEGEIVEIIGDNDHNNAELNGWARVKIQRSNALQDNKKKDKSSKKDDKSKKKGQQDPLPDGIFMGFVPYSYLIYNHQEIRSQPAISSATMAPYAKTAITAGGAAQQGLAFIQQQQAATIQQHQLELQEKVQQKQAQLQQSPLTNPFSLQSSQPQQQQQKAPDSQSSDFGLVRQQSIPSTKKQAETSPYDEYYSNPNYQTDSTGNLKLNAAFNSSGTAKQNDIYGSSSDLYGEIGRTSGYPQSSSSSSSSSSYGTAYDDPYTLNNYSNTPGTSKSSSTYGTNDGYDIYGSYSGSGIGSTNVGKGSNSNSGSNIGKSSDSVADTPSFHDMSNAPFEGQKKTTKVKKVKVLYDYTASSDIELSVKKGETLLLIENSSSNSQGWVYCQRKGKGSKEEAGYVPAEFIKQT